MRRRSEHAPIHSRPATTLLLFKVRRQIYVRAESTAQSANREKSSKLAFDPGETGSPVDLGCRIPAKMRVFDTEKKRIPKTEDSLAEGVEFELSGDLLNGQ